MYCSTNNVRAVVDPVWASFTIMAYSRPNIRRNQYRRWFVWSREPVARPPESIMISFSPSFPKGKRVGVLGRYCQRLKYAGTTEVVPDEPLSARQKQMWAS
jgi:hypothetical protein